MAVAVLLASTCSALAADYTHSLIVHLTDGSEVEYLFEDMPVAFVEGTDVRIQVQASGMEVTYPMDDMVNMTIKREMVGVENIIAAEGRVKFGVNRESLDASGLMAGQHVVIYDATGALRAEGTCDADGVVSIAIGDFGPGVYIVNAGKNSFKFIR